jgi:hypothetical protein
VIMWNCNNSGSDGYEGWNVLANVSGSEGFTINNIGDANCGCAMHPSGDQSFNGVKIFINRPPVVGGDSYLWNFPELEN